MEPSKVYDAESERLYLQFVTEEHLYDYHAIQSNKEAMMWSTSAPHTTLEQTLNRIRKGQPTEEAPWNKRWAIILKDSEPKLKMIGIIGMVRDSEIGYKLHPDYWGKGYMSEAMKVFFDMVWKAEEYKNYDKILACADPDNKGSVRVLEKAGFKKGALLKGYYSRPFLGDDSIRSDIQKFYLARPGVAEKKEAA